MFNRSKPKLVPNQRQIESMKDQRSNRCSVQKKNTSMLTPFYEQLGGTSNQKIQYFSFRLKEPVDQTDPTLAWQYNVPIILPNEKSIFFSTLGFTTVVQDYVGDDFPQTINISLDNVSGLIDFSGNPTNKVLALTLCDINSTQTNGMVSRDLIYKNDMTCFWPIQRTLKMRVFLDQEPNPIAFPIQNPIALTFKIVHLSV